MAARWTWLIAVLLALALTACGDGAVRPGNESEPPPQGWAQLGMNPTYSLVTVPDRAAADRMCRALHVAANDQFNPHQIEACVSPATQQVVLSANAPEATRIHEFTHTWGPVHHGGHGWFYPNGQPVGPLSPQQAAMMLAMAQAQYAQQMRTYQGLQAMSPGTPPVAGR